MNRGENRRVGKMSKSKVFKFSWKWDSYWVGTWSLEDFTFFFFKDRRQYSLLWWMEMTQQKSGLRTPQDCNANAVWLGCRGPQSMQRSWVSLKPHWELYQGQGGASFTKNTTTQKKQTMLTSRAVVLKVWAAFPENGLEMHILGTHQSNWIRNSKN